VCVIAGGCLWVNVGVLVYSLPGNYYVDSGYAGVPQSL